MLAKYKKYIIITLLFFSIFEDGFAVDGSVERDFYSALDLLCQHEYLLNPAIYLPTVTQATASMIKSNGTVDLAIDQNQNLSETTSKFSKDVLAASITIDGGSGLGLGFRIEKIDKETETTGTRVRNAVIEKQESLYGAGRAVIELSESFRIGVMFKVLQLENNIYGNIFLRESDNTQFKSTLLGTGGGMIYDANPWIFGATYNPPLKGKTEIYGEELIIIEPGLADISIVINQGQYRFGLSHNRYLYKKDDRGKGSSVSNANNTPIDLFGLNPNDNLIRPLEEYLLGMELEMTANVNLMVNVTRKKSEFNFNLDSEIPGENPENKFYEHLEVKLLLKIESTNFNYTIGVSHQDAKHEFDLRNSNFQYKSSQLKLLAMVFKNL